MSKIAEQDKPSVDDIRFYEMLHDFEYFVKVEGVDYVLNRIDPGVLKKLADFFDN